MKPSLHISRATLLAALIFVVPIIADAGIELPDDPGPVFLPIIMGGPGNVPIGGLWQEFFFREAGTPAEGCATVSYCVPSPSGNSEFAAASPWVFVAPGGGATLIVADVANSGDVFSIFDFDALIGTTSQATTGFFCGLDPESCLHDLNMSSGMFALEAGPHEITIVPILSPLYAGAAYFRVTSGTSSVQYHDDVNAIWLSADSETSPFSVKIRMN